MHNVLPDLSDKAKSLEPGIYRHYKGGEYELVGVAFIEEDLGEAVVYKSLEDGVLWVRPIEDFTAHVIKENYEGPRFVRVRGLAK